MSAGAFFAFLAVVALSFEMTVNAAVFGALAFCVISGLLGGALQATSGLAKSLSCTHPVMQIVAGRVVGDH
jgi:hypothetical protein